MYLEASGAAAPSSSKFSYRQPSHFVPAFLSDEQELEYLVILSALEMGEGRLILRIAGATSHLPGALWPGQSPSH